jgi:hypothetical protein
MRNRQTMIETVRALLAKTREHGATEAEELAALDKARAMMDAYEINDDDLQLTKEEGAILRAEADDLGDPHGIKWQLAYAVGKFCGVKIYRNSRNKEKDGSKFVFVGGKADCDFAEYLLCNHLCDFVQVEIMRHMLGSLAPSRERRTIIRNFVDGITQRVSERLEALMVKSEKARTSKGNELIVIRDQAIKDKLKDEGVRLRSCSGGSFGNFDPGAYGAGRVAGERASFGRPVSGSGGILRLGRS